MPAPLVLLVDVGSRQAAAFQGLLAKADELARRTGRRVEAASLQFADQAPGLPQGTAATRVLAGKLGELRDRGVTDLTVLPWILGPSAAAARVLPGILATSGSGLSIRRAEVLAPAPEPAPPELVEALAGLVEEVGPAPGASVIVVDHGSPDPQVTAVRDRAARALADRLGRSVVAASMERRPGPEYAFADPLLADALRAPGIRGCEVVLARLFLAAGRHAGPGGDLDRIVAEARAQDPGLSVRVPARIGDHPALLDLLVRRLREAEAEAARAS